MKKFEKETKDVQERLKQIGEIIENAKNVLVEKKAERRRARENYKKKTTGIKKLREQYQRIVGQYDFMDFIRKLDAF